MTQPGEKHTPGLFLKLQDSAQPGSPKRETRMIFVNGMGQAEICTETPEDLEIARRIVDTVNAAPATAAELEKCQVLLRKFLQLEGDGNTQCKAAKEKMMELCPEFRGYLDQARAALKLASNEKGDKS